MQTYLFKIWFKILVVLGPASNARTNALATRSPWP